jgi:hypothetical protein
VRGFSYQDDFGDYERVKQRSSIGEIRDLKLLQQEHAVSRKSTKENRQIQKDDGYFQKLMCDLVLKARFL